MRSLKENLIETLNNQKFHDAYLQFLDFINFYYARKTKQKPTIENIRKNLQERLHYIKKTNVRTPAEMDELYAYSLVGLQESLQEVEKLEDCVALYQEFLNENTPLERYIYGDNFAVCLNIETAEGKTIAFSFDMDDFYPDYDKKIVEMYSDLFGLEDGEVLFAKQSIHRRLSLDELIKIAKEHPASAIDIINMETGKSLVDGSDFSGFTLPRKPWFWKESA